MFIGDGAAIRVAWLQSATQLLRRPGLHDGRTEEDVWRSATFGAHWLRATTTLEGVASAAVLEHPHVLVASTALDDITSAGVLRSPHAIVASTTLDDVTSSAELVLGHRVTAATALEGVASAALLSALDVLEVGTIAAPTPILGPSEIAIGFNDAPIDIDVGTIPAPPLPVGPHSIVIEGADAPPAMYATLHSPDGTLLSTLPEQFGLSWQDVDSEVGAGRISMPMVGWDEDTGLPTETDWALMRPGCFVRCYLYGVEAFTWRIERDPVITRIEEGEEFAMVVTASGRGWSSELSTAVVDPPWTDGAGNPLNNPLNPSQRAYTFASDDFPRWDQWPAVQSAIPYSYLNPQRYQLVSITTVVEDAEDEVVTTAMPAPLGFPVDTAYWIWPTADTSIVGKVYMRQIFGIGPGPKQVSITATADNFYTLYLNGTPIFGEIEDSGAWREFTTISVVLPAGYHTLAVMVENIEWAPGLANPGGFICAVYETDSDGLPTTVWCQTDGNWTGLGYPPVVPGFTPAEIIFNVVFSAQVRGQLLDFDFDFNAGYDSAGNPWPYIPGIAFNVGDTLLDVLDELHRQSWVDWRIKPGSRTLQMWNWDTGRSAAAATYSSGVDIKELSVEEADLLVNRLLVKWTRGYFRVDDTASQMALGIISEAVLVVDTEDLDEATRRAEAVLANLANPKPSIIVDIEPQNDADRPYVSYGVRDTVTAPDSAGTPTVYPVISISVTQDDEGDPDITLELNRRARIVERDEFQLLQQLGSGIQGSLESSDQLVSIRAISLVD